MGSPESSSTAPDPAVDPAIGEPAINSEAGTSAAAPPDPAIVGPNSGVTAGGAPTGAAPGNDQNASTDEGTEALHLPVGLVAKLKAEAARVGQDFETWAKTEFDKLTHRNENGTTQSAS